MNLSFKSVCNKEHKGVICNMTSSSNSFQSTRPTWKNYFSFIDFTRYYKLTSEFLSPVKILEHLPYLGSACYGLSIQCALLCLRAMWCLSFTVVFGEDVAFGGVFRCTIGLKDKYGRLLSYCTIGLKDKYGRLLSYCTIGLKDKYGRLLSYCTIGLKDKYGRLLSYCTIGLKDKYGRLLSYCTIGLKDKYGRLLSYCTIGLKDKYGRLLSVYYRLKRQIW